MLTVVETVQDYKIEILLAKETFDSTITPVRAWAAQMELDGMKERMEMGVKARLQAEQIQDKIAMGIFVSVKISTLSKKK